MHFAKDNANMNFVGGVGMLSMVFLNANWWVEYYC